MKETRALVRAMESGVSLNLSHTILHGLHPGTGH